MTDKANPLVYKGSVKNIRMIQEPKKRSPGRYAFEFTDDYSVFDYGKMPDRIRGKGELTPFPPNGSVATRPLGAPKFINEQQRRGV